MNSHPGFHHYRRAPLQTRSGGKTARRLWVGDGLSTVIASRIFPSDCVGRCAASVEPSQFYKPFTFVGPRKKATVSGIGPQADCACAAWLRPSAAVFAVDSSDPRHILRHARAVASVPLYYRRLDIDFTVRKLSVYGTLPPVLSPLVCSSRGPAGSLARPASI